MYGFFTFCFCWNVACLNIVKWIRNIFEAEKNISWHYNIKMYCQTFFFLVHDHTVPDKSEIWGEKRMWAGCYQLMQSAVSTWCGHTCPHDEQDSGCHNLIKADPRPTQLIGAIEWCGPTQSLPFLGSTAANSHWYDTSWGFRQVFRRFVFSLCSLQFLAKSLQLPPDCNFD